MKYLITHLKEKNPNSGTAHASLNDSYYRREIIDGELSIKGDIVTINDAEVSSAYTAMGGCYLYKKIMFCASLNNVTIQEVKTT